MSLLKYLQNTEIETDNKITILDYLTENEKKSLYYILLAFVLYGFVILNGTFAEQELKIDSKLLNEEDYKLLFDINTVKMEELLHISGIGEATAKSIINYQQNTGFTNVADLMEIRGIGEKKHNDFKDYFYVSEDMYKEKSTEKISNKKVITKVNNNVQKIININTATTEELMTLHGIGKVKAEEIINYRTNIDKFQKIDDILNVKGIGPKTFESIKQNISIG